MKKWTAALLSGVLGIGIGAAADFYYFCRKIINREKQIDLYRANYDLLRRWLKLKQEGKSLEESLLELGYASIAVYSMNEVGELLCEELKDTQVLVRYGIDTNLEGKTTDLPMIQPQEGLQKVDAIIVCDLIYYEQIQEMLEQIVSCPVLAVDDLIYGI